MNIIVCIKQVPDTAEVKIDPEKGTLVREGVPSIVNPFDEFAVEEALCLRAKFGGKVTAITMGPPQAVSALRQVVAMGADEAVLLSDRAFAGSDTWATSYTLAAAIRKTGPVDIILCGKQAIDGDTAQVGPGVAEFLKWPVVTYVRKLEVDGDKVKIERTFEDGYEKIEAPLPVVVTTVKEMNIPRMASLKGRMSAKKAQIKLVTADAAKADPAEIGLKGSPTRVVRIFTPPKKAAGIRIDGTEPLVAARELVAKLKEQKII